MTSITSSFKDPTKVTSQRVVAYLIDVAVATVLVGVVLFAFEFSHYTTSDRRNLSAAGNYCTEVNKPGPFKGTPYDIGPVASDPEHEFCFNIGTTAYVLMGDEVAEARLHVIGYTLGLSLLYWVLIPGLTGASLGKRIVGLRVVKADGSRAGVVPSAVRWVLLAVDGAFCGVVGYIVMASSTGHRRLGDMAARTYVVHKRDSGSPVLERLEPPPAPPRAVPAPPLGMPTPPPPVEPTT